MGNTVSAIFTAIIGVAILAVLVSQKATTASVITSAGNAFSSILASAVAPITGAVNTSTGSSSFLSGSGVSFPGSVTSGLSSFPLGSLGLSNSVSGGDLSTAFDGAGVVAGF